MSRVIEVTEVILRDAHQSLMATRLATDDMIPALQDLDNAGYWSLECWGGATFDSAIRFLNEDPWERLRTFKKHLKKTPTQMLFRAQNILGYRHYGDDVVRRFVDKSAENGMNVFRIFDAMNDPRNLECAIKEVKKLQSQGFKDDNGLGVHVQGCICYTISPVHTIEKFVELGRQLQDMGVDSICIKDMAALIKPQPAHDLVKAIKKACGEKMPVHLHVHATTGVTLVSIMKAVEAGLDIVDTALSAMSLGTGHNPTEAFAEMLEGTPYTHRLDMKRVASANEHFKNIPLLYDEFYTSFTGVTTSIFESQIPGGMLSNMESQLKAQGAGDRINEVLAAVPKVKAAAGHPPLVTPTSQIVGTQAVFNVLMGEWKSLVGEFTDLVLGYYGKPTTDCDPEVVKIAQKQAGKPPITCRPADLIENEWDKLKAEAGALAGYNGSDEDVLTFALFPKVAPQFFKDRAQGPKKVSKKKASEKAAAPQAVSAPAPTPVAPRDYTVTVNGQPYHVHVAPGKTGAPVMHTVAASGPAPVPVAAAAPSSAPQSPASVAGQGYPVKAALAGTVLRFSVSPGERIAQDQTVLVLEAMKMENEIASPRAGTLHSFAVKEGDAVKAGTILAYIS
jgi:methylmalonyl-CoA carboxyltransferase 5S subunit